MFRRALVPLHLSEKYTHIHAIGQLLVQLGVEQTVLLHVGRSDERMHARMAMYADELADYPLEVETRFRSGSPALSIVQAAVAERADMIAVVWGRKNWLERTLVGSTTQDVIRMAAVPVLVTKTLPADPAAPLQLLYATDFQATDAVVMPYIRELAGAAGRLVLLHVGGRAPDPFAEEKRQARVMSSLERLQDESGYSDSSVVSRIGVPSRVIARNARREQTDVVLLGKNDRSAALGSTAEAAAVRCSSSLFIIPNTGIVPAAGTEVSYA